MKFWAVAGLLLAGACQAPEFSVQASPIINGSFEPGRPAVVALSDGFRAFCTGTLISRRVIVTAAHCVEPNLTGIDPANLLVFFGPDFNRGDGFLMDVEFAEPHPGFDTASLQNDIGAVMLLQDPPVAPDPFLAEGFDDSFLGQTIQFVGFGLPYVIGGDSGLKRTVASSIQDFNSTQFFYDGSAGGTCFGDSGGPAYLSRAQGDTVVGVTSFGDNSCSVFGADTRVDAFVPSFLSEILAREPLPVEGCTLDGACNAACDPTDPDCFLINCDGGNECNRLCATLDPDCEDLSCETDGLCDGRCADAQADEDCRCQADGVCADACAADPDCGGCAISPEGEGGRGFLAPLVGALLLLGWASQRGRRAALRA
jgi:hypothetical protein